MGNIDDPSCQRDLQIEKKRWKNAAELSELKVVVPSQAKDEDERLKRVANGKEIIAFGQEDTEINRAAVRSLRSKLNLALPECAKLDEQSGVFDKQVEQRVAQFQARHQSGLDKLKIDGIVGENTFKKLDAEINKDGPNDKQGATSPNSDPSPTSALNVTSEDLSKPVRSHESIIAEKRKWDELKQRRKALGPD